MKANIFLVAVAIVLLGVIAVVNNGYAHWTMLFPLAYIFYALIIGLISWYRNTFY